MKGLIIKKCQSCGSVVEVLHDCACECCGIQCCDRDMIKVKPNSVDADFEKHVPTYEIQGDKILVKVNHVMAPEHFIEWIALATDTQVYKHILKPGEKAEAIFPYVKGAKLYSYCNKHALWSSDVK